VRTGTGIVCAGAVLLALAGAPALAEAGGPEQLMLETLNGERAKRRLPPLRESTRLRHTARAHGRLMLRLDFFGHLRSIRGPSGYRTLGEVIAWRSGRRPGTREVLRAWLRSPPHRRVLLNPRLRLAGAALVRGARGRRKGVAWTMHLGRR
jgi:uncharacterized protein YkwD